MGAQKCAYAQTWLAKLFKTAFLFLNTSQYCLLMAQFRIQIARKRNGVLNKIFNWNIINGNVRNKKYFNPSLRICFADFKNVSQQYKPELLGYWQDDNIGYFIAGVVDITSLWRHLKTAQRYLELFTSSKIVCKSHVLLLY